MCLGLVLCEVCVVIKLEAGDPSRVVRLQRCVNLGLDNEGQVAPAIGGRSC